MGVLDKIFGSKNHKILKKVQPLVRAINGLEEDYSRLQDEDLKNKRNHLITKFKYNILQIHALVELFCTTLFLSLM